MASDDLLCASLVKIEAPLVSMFSSFSHIIICFVEDKRGVVRRRRRRFFGVGVTKLMHSEVEATSGLSRFARLLGTRNGGVQVVVVFERSGEEVLALGEGDEMVLMRDPAYSEEITGEVW